MPHTDLRKSLGMLLASVDTCPLATLNLRHCARSGALGSLSVNVRMCSGGAHGKEQCVCVCVSEADLPRSTTNKLSAPPSCSHRR